MEEGVLVGVKPGVPELVGVRESDGLEVPVCDDVGVCVLEPEGVRVGVCDGDGVCDGVRV